MHATFKQVALKIGPQSISQNRNIKCVGNVTQLANLFSGQKLCFIDKHTMQWTLAVKTVHDFQQVVDMREQEGMGLESNPHNFLLMHAMGPNVAGVIGSAVAAGVLLAVVGGG